MNWLLKLLFVALSQLMEAAIKVFAAFINNIFDVMYEINQGLGLEKIGDYTRAFAISLVGILAVKQLFSIYILTTDGDPDMDPLDILTRVCVSIAVIVCGNDLLNYGIKMAGVMAKDALGQITIKKTIADTFTQIITVLVGSNTPQMIVYLILLLISLISLIIFVLKAAKRGAELMLISILLPIMACDLITTSKERWNSFFTVIMTTIFGYIIQLVCFTIFEVLFAKIGTSLNPKYMIASAAWILLVLSAPKWLDKFAYTSGIGNMAKGGARSATFIIPSMLRK